MRVTSQSWDDALVILSRPPTANSTEEDFATAMALSCKGDAD